MLYSAVLKKLTYTGLPLLAASFVVHSADVDETVVVTATQSETPWLTTAASIDRVSVENTLPSMKIDAGDALAGVAGIQADSRYNYAQDTRLVVRGFGSRAAFGVRGLQLNVDGIPLSMPDGQAQTSSIFLDSIDSLEVLRGPLATLYGNSGGGVVEWFSRKPTETALEWGGQFSENDTQRYNVNAQWATNTNQLQILASDFQTDGPRRHNSAERQQQAIRWYHQWDEQNRFVIRYDNSDAPLLQDPSALTPEDWREDPTQTVQRAVDFNTRKDIHHRQGSFSWFHERDNGEGLLSLWQGDRDIEQFLPFAGDGNTSSGAVIDVSRQFEGAHARWRQRGINWSATVGAQLERQQDHRFGYVNDNGEKGDLRRNEFNWIENASAYLRFQWQLSEELSATGGVRYSDINYEVEDYFTELDNSDDSGSSDFSETTAAVSVTWQFLPTSATYLSIGQGFETPTLTELAYRNQGSGLNRELGPSTNDQWEWGIKHQLPQDWRLHFAFFGIKSEDEIVVDQSNDGRTTYRNASETSREGAELSINGALTQQLDLLLSYSYIDATFDNGPLQGNQLPGVAKSQGYLRLNWQPTEQWLVQLAGQYRNETPVNDANDTFAPSYTTWDIAVSRDWQWVKSELDVWARVDNITDKDYVGAVVVNQQYRRYFEPAVGRQASVGISWRRRF
ncbi:TonB-dependent receptor family protein [Idiomarina sp.]|uniref:TonB-dependent receptor family protein n=1 Tax=Idiomarina sp. TaxID=1874361 RepID=UPI003A8E6962